MVFQGWKIFQNFAQSSVDGFHFGLAAAFYPER
jgi:hypothetical protein